MLTLRKAGATASAIAVLPFVSSGCGTSEKDDAQRTPGHNIDHGAPALVIQMPDSFSNVAVKCDRWGHRVYVTSHGDQNRPSQIQIIDDPSCPGGDR